MSAVMVVRTASGRASHLSAGWRPGYTQCGRGAVEVLPDAWRVDCRVCERGLTPAMKDELDARWSRQREVDAESTGPAGRA